MQRKLDQWTTALAVLGIVATLLACKKRTSVTAPAAETAVALPAPPAEPTPAATPSAPAAEAAAAATSEPKVGEVKRYPDKEKAQTGAVRILADDVKVFNEADDKTPEVATLTKNLLVFRIASVPDYELVEFPSGVGKVSPGWVLAKFVDAQADAKVARAAVAAQTAAVVKEAPKATGTKTTTSAASSAKAAADKAAVDKAAADKAAADKAAADKAAADKAALEKAAAQAERAFKKGAERLKQAAGGTSPK